MGIGATAPNRVVRAALTKIAVLRSDAFPPITRASLTETAMKTQQEYDYPRAFGFMDEKHIALRVQR
ncbi:hypothetical protein ANCDUO_08492 [Ancylostoma duodenale]|uniref:DDE Tnp4 domain-containing protein n=1 Tax=Ancylostoma duodenale TaxID=51022 RepID=A0A0C2DFL3_9BILA|nr:hypothetical protein ANCDUO_08492 [Ancylostoma duodenale]